MSLKRFRVTHFIVHCLFDLANVKTAKLIKHSILKYGFYQTHDDN